MRQQNEIEIRVAESRALSDPRTTVYALDREAEPRLVVDPGAVVTVETHDARGGRLKRPDQVEETTPDFSERFPKANPATGPIYIRGAAPGSAVTIDILSIDLDPLGFILVKPDMGIIRGLSPKPIARDVRGAGGEVQFGKLRFPVRPMVGVIGVAPAGEAIGTAYVGDHGGNIDTILAAVGNRIDPTRAGRGRPSLYRRRSRGDGGRRGLGHRNRDRRPCHGADRSRRPAC